MQTADKGHDCLTDTFPDQSECCWSRQQPMGARYVEILVSGDKREDIDVMLVSKNKNNFRVINTSVKLIFGLAFV